jgi:hypothetical protein
MSSPLYVYVYQNHNGICKKTILFKLEEQYQIYILHTTSAGISSTSLSTIL